MPWVAFVKRLVLPYAMSSCIDVTGNAGLTMATFGAARISVIGAKSFIGS